MVLDPLLDQDQGIIELCGSSDGPLQDSESPGDPATGGTRASQWDLGISGPRISMLVQVQVGVRARILVDLPEWCGRTDPSLQPQQQATPLETSEDVGTCSLGFVLVIRGPEAQSCWVLQKVLSMDPGRGWSRSSEGS